MKKAILIISVALMISGCHTKSNDNSCINYLHNADQIIVSLLGDPDKIMPAPGSCEKWVYQSTRLGDKTVEIMYNVELGSIQAVSVQK